MSPTCVHTHTQTEKARHILQVREKILEQKKLERGIARMPSDRELNKLSDEHKAMLAQKCVLLLMGRKGKEEEKGVQKTVRRWSGKGRGERRQGGKGGQVRGEENGVERERSGEGG